MKHMSFIVYRLMPISMFIILIIFLVMTWAKSNSVLTLTSSVCCEKSEVPCFNSIVNAAIKSSQDGLRNEALFWASMLLAHADYIQKDVDMPAKSSAYMLSGMIFERYIQHEEALVSFTNAINATQNTDYRKRYRLYALRGNTFLHTDECSKAAFDYADAIIIFFSERSSAERENRYSIDDIVHLNTSDCGVVIQSKFQQVDDLVAFLTKYRNNIKIETAIRLISACPCSNAVPVQPCACPTDDQRPENGGGNAETGGKMNDKIDENRTEKGESPK